MLLVAEIERLLRENGAAEVGFARVADAPEGLPVAVSVVVPLSDAVLDEIENAPTHTYFHHYRTVNALIDRLLLQAGLLLQKNGYRYLPIAASQSIHKGGERVHEGRYSHKKAAVLAGLGTVGKNALFQHRDYGPRVRLGTLFTDCPLTEKSVVLPSRCGTCTACVEACPAKAIKGGDWKPGIGREALVDAAACNEYMRAHFMNIGRGAVCGICVKVCPMRRKR
jgi:epoxyqueuosine reductase QueG